MPGLDLLAGIFVPVNNGLLDGPGALILLTLATVAIVVWMAGHLVEAHDAAQQRTHPSEIARRTRDNDRDTQSPRGL